MVKFEAVCLVALLGYSEADYEPLHTYIPKSKVTDHVGISFDQAIIEKLVGKNSDQAFHSAKRVYSEGGNSKSVAHLEISGGLSHRVHKGTVIHGMGLSETAVVGTAYDNFNQGVTTLQVLYDTTESQATYSDCRVGGLPPLEQHVEGCLTDQGTPTIIVGTTPYKYTYNITKGGTVNERTIQRFSIDANVRMRPGSYRTRDYYDTFKPYVDYYGDYAYADKLILAGLNGISVTLNQKSWNFDLLDFDGRAEIVKKGTSLLATGMYAIREMEDAVYDCTQKCRPSLDACNDDEKAASLDEAVAFYVGAKSVDPQGLGNLFYSLPEKECGRMGTCTEGIKGHSKVNEEVFKQLNLMQHNLIALQCEAAKENMDIIVRNMYVALIQGAIRHAWITENDPSAGDKQKAEGAMFTAAVLPKVDACNPIAADVIYQTARIGGRPDFASVKKAFESVYSCMGITCEDVGGVIDEATRIKFAVGAEPCTAFVFEKSSAKTPSLQLSTMMGATFIACAVAMLM